MDEKTRATMNTIGRVLAVPLALIGLYGAYYVFTYKPKPKPPEPKIETFRADGKKKDASPGAAAKAAKASSEPQVWDVELVWEVSNADEVSIEPGIGKVAASGSRHVDLEKSTTFVMKAKNVSGEITYNLDVDIAPPER